MGHPSTILALALAAAACGADATGKDTATASAPTWRLSGSPLVSIGEADGDPDYQLFRVSDAVVLRDGSIVVVNTGSSTLAVYDREGRFAMRIGGKGQGPGEFEVPLWVEAGEGDTLVAWDSRLRRLSYFDRTGRLARLTTLSDAEGMFLEAVGRLADGSFLVGRGPDVFAMMQGRSGVWRDSTTLQRFGPDGRRTGTLGPFPDDEMYLLDRPGGFAWNDLPFGRRTVLAATRHGLYVGDTGTGEISILSPDGTRSGVLRSPHGAWKVSPDDVARYRQERLSRITDPDRRREMEQTLAEAPFPETSPLFGDMAVDPDGSVWVQAHPRPGEEATWWTVLGRDGSVLGRIEVPSALKVHEVGRDYVLGLRYDDLDVEHVELYAVERPRPAVSGAHPGKPSVP